MSATPNNTGAGWIDAPSDPKQAGSGVSDDGVAGQDALQALLAFACIQEQASRRYSPDDTQQNSIEDFGLDDVLRLVAARALSITGADGVAIALAEAESIVCRATIGRVAPDRGMRLDPKSGFSGECLRSGESVKCDDSETDSRVNPQACRTLGARSMIAVPLSAKHRVIGLIEAFSSDAYGFNETDVRSLNLLGELILSAIRPEEEDRIAQLAAQLIPEPVSPSIHRSDDMSAPQITDRPVLGEEEVVSEVSKRESVATELKSSSAAMAESSAAPETTSVAESSAVPEALPEPLVEPITVGDREPHKHPVLKIAVAVSLFAVAILLAWGIVWKVRHLEQGISANARTGSQSGQVPDSIGPASQSPPVRPGINPQITGIRHWSSADSSSVVVDLEDQVQYEAHSLDNPPRIYFDLHETKVVATLMNQSIDVDDTFIKRIRVAQPEAGITRVVLETKGELEFFVSLDPNPYRLTINVHRPTGSPSPSTTPVTIQKPSPAIEQGKRSAPSESSELKLVLDAGHGGWDLGTVGRKGLLEKELVLDVVGRLGKLVSDKLGLQVIYTRSDDSYLPLEKRAEIANLAQANLFLSVHANYSDLATARGVETFYTNTYSSLKARSGDDDPKLKAVNWTGVDIRAKVTDSHRLAGDIQRALYAALVARNPELRDRGVKRAEYVVLTGTQMPAVLAEVSFVSSPADEDKLQNSEYRQQIAEALFAGVEKYCHEAKHMKLAKSIN